MNLGIILAASLLFILTNISIAHLLSLPLAYGVAVAAVLIILVFISRLLLSGNIKTAIEKVCLFLLIIVSTVVSWKALLPLLYDGSLEVERSLPLLLSTAALYIFYFLLNQTVLVAKNISLQNKLTSFFSGPPLILTAIVSLIITAYILLAIQYGQLHYPDFSYIAEKFLARGIIPPITVFLFCWCSLIIVNKTYTLGRERRALNHQQLQARKSVLLQVYFSESQNHRRK